MKKLMTNLWSRLLVLMALVTVSATASAIDLGELQLNTDYPLSDFQSYEGYFVAPSSGKLMYPNMLTPYYDAAHENEISSNYEGYVNGLSTSSIQVAEGQTYYFYADFLWSGGNFRLQMDMPFALDFRSLEEGATLSCSGRGAIELKMTDNPAFSKVTFTCNTQSMDWTNISVVRQEKYIVIEYAAKLLSFIEANPEYCSKTCQVVIDGLHVDGDDTKLYNGTGKLTLNFVVGNMPTKLVSENLSTASIDSWFRPSEEKGLFTFTFNNPIKSGSIVMGYGANVESDDYYNETPEMTIDGNNVIVDLRGTQRRLELQTDDYDNPCQFYFKLQSFIDENDGYIYSTDQGSLGSISFNVPYNLITTELISEFTPAANAELAAVDNVEIYFTPATDVLFDGVKVTWADNATGVTIAKEDLTIEYDEYDGCTVTFAVPAEAKSARNVNVTLAGLDTPDGLDHADAVTIAYNTAEIEEPAEFSVTLVSPVDGAELAGFVAEESRILVLAQNVPTDADELEVMARIYDPAYDDPIYTAYLWAATPEEGETEVYNYAQTIYESLDFVKGVDYTINITVNKVTYPAAGGRDVVEIANNNYTIHGTAEAYVYSEAALVGITPNPVTTDIISTDQNIITLEFDAPVTVTKAGTAGGMGSGLIAWTVAKANDEGTAWTVEIPTSTIENSKSSFSVSFWAVDAEGKPVYKTTVEGLPEPTQNKENTYFNFTYTCTVGAPDFVVDPASDTELEVLDKIYVSYPSGINPSYNTSLPITLYKGKGYEQETVQEWDSNYFDMWNEDVCVEYDSETNYKWCITLDQPITEPGYYTFVFPNAFFNLGSEYSQALSPITNVHYIIPEPAADLLELTTNPEPGVVENLLTIELTNPELEEATIGATVDITITNDADEVVYTVTNEDLYMNAVDFDWNYIGYILTPNITEAGVYTLNIPEGAFEFESTHSAALTAEFEIEEVIEVPEGNVLFFWSNPKGADDYVADFGTIEQKNGTSDRLNYANTALDVAYKTICLNGKKANLNDEDGSDNACYMVVTFTEPLQEGDIIDMTAFRNKNATGKGSSAYVLFDNNTSTTIGGSDGLGFVNLNVDGETPEATEPNTLSYTITAENAGATSMKLTRDKTSTNLFITSLVVYREESEPEFVVPEELYLIGGFEPALLEKDGMTYSATGVRLTAFSDEDYAYVWLNTTGGNEVEFGASYEDERLFNGQPTEIVDNGHWWAVEPGTYNVSVEWFEDGRYITLSKVDIEGEAVTVYFQADETWITPFVVYITEDGQYVEKAMDPVAESAEEIRALAASSNYVWTAEIPANTITFQFYDVDDDDYNRVSTVYEESPVNNMLYGMAGQLGDYSAVLEIVNENNNNAVYYNLQGVRVANPVEGKIYIVVRGNKATKELKK